ncbi:MAG: DMT family transporter [Pseudomonadota bacterium]
MLKRLAHPYVLLVLTTLFWSGNIVLGRAIHGQVPPIALSFWRWAIAFALTLPLALPHFAAQWPLLKGAWRVLLTLGLLGVACYNTFAYIALQYTPATNAVLLNAFIPIATIVLSYVFLQKKLRTIEWLGVFFSFVGVVSIICQGQWQLLGRLQLNVGDLWMLGAVIVWAIYTIGLQWRPAGLNPMLMLAAITSVGVLALAPLYAWEMLSQGKYVQLSVGALAGIAYTGVFPGFLGYVFYNRAVGEIGANKASLFIHLMPVFGILLAVVFLGETLKTYHYFGIALIFTGIYLTTARQAKRSLAEA